MKDKKSQFGYTILEVMIVLAVSGVMFVIAVSFINDKQARTAFPQGVNEMTAQLQGVIDDVTDGKYSDVAIECTGVSDVMISPNTGGDKQGRNASCVFRGKLVHFYKEGTSNPQKYGVISLVDLRSSSDIILTKIKSDTLLVQQEVIPQNLSIINSTITTSAGAQLSNPNNIGFVQSLGTSDGVVGYKSGAQQISLIHVNSPDTQTGQQTAESINNPSVVTAVKSFRMCISDGERYANIIVGGSNDNNLTVTTKMLGKNPC